LRKLREGQGPEIVSIPVPQPSVAPAPAQKPFRAETATHQPAAQPVPAVQREQPATVPSATGTAQLSQLWGNLVEAVGRVSAFTRSYLLEAHPVSLARNVFTIGFDPEFEEHIALVDVARNHTLLQTKLAELGHPGVQIKFIKAETPAGWQRSTEPAPVAQPASRAAAANLSSAAETTVSAPPIAPVKERAAPIAFSKDDFKNDPLIQKALEIFKGQIVEVRA